MSQKPRERVGASPAKLALIGILGLVLVMVVWSNWPQSAARPEQSPASDELNTESLTQGTTSTAPRVPAAVSPAATGGASGGPASPFGEFATDDSWPEMPLKEVTKFDPFATAAWAIPPEADKVEQAYNEEQIKELLSAENAIIFTAGDVRVARIGTQEFRVGDIIGGFKISDISSRGVVLSEAE